MVQIIKRYGFVVYPTNRRPVCTNQVPAWSHGRGARDSEAMAAGGPWTVATLFLKSSGSLSLSLREEEEEEELFVFIGYCRGTQSAR